MLSVEDDYSEFVEVDPGGRYGRYNEVLGKGASKTVYRAFDLYEGIEVAWNQVKLSNCLRASDYLERLYSEIHLLRRLKHPNIMKLYASWADVSEMTLNFVTEMFTSGTLRQYRLKHKRVNIRAVKDWCRQILRGLQYLHSQKPPVIHRDLKCDNIFVNGNQGEIKIGDLGLAGVLQNVSESHCVGTPEFMAPEVYNEKYNELVDIYSFGMCILEMVTFEYPYSECTTPAQIYLKVISGRKPDGLYQVQDPEVFQFIEKCLADVSERPSARELLNDPFLQVQNFGTILRQRERELNYLDPVWRHLILGLTHKTNSSGNNSSHENSDTSPVESEWSWVDNENELDNHFPEFDIAIKGKKLDDGNLLFRLRISSEDAEPRNIHFQFDLENDTALSVATEMVQELDITDHDVTKIAEMIDLEIAVLLPNSRKGLEMEETPHADNNFCQKCASSHTSNGSLMSRCENGCVHGRFQEYRYDVNHNTQKPKSSIKSNNFQQEEYWNHHGSFECSETGSGDSHSLEEQSKQTGKEDKDPSLHKSFTKSLSTPNSVALSSRELSLDYDHEVSEEEFRWLQAKYDEMEEIIKQQMKIHVEIAGEGGSVSSE